MDSNHRRHRQQIYSLPHLATLVTARFLKRSAKIPKNQKFRLRCTILMAVMAASSPLLP